MTPNSEHAYGTPEYYAHFFNDVICDANGDLQTACNILKGFQLAVQDWIDFHSKSLQNYDQLHNQFLKNHV